MTRCPDWNSCNACAEKVEKVVNPPQKPTAANRYVPPPETTISTPIKNVVALIFRIIEKMREETIKDPHILELEDENDIYLNDRDKEYGDFDEFGDL